MGWLAAQGAIMAIGLFIGLVCSVIGLLFGHIILFDSISMTPQDAQFLKELAREGVASRGLIGDLKNKLETLKRDVSVWKRKYEKLQEQTKDFMAALKRAPRKVKEFIQFMLHTEPEKPEQSRSVLLFENLRFPQVMSRRKHLKNTPIA